MASSTVPSTMRALVATKYCTPKDYQVIELPVPKIQRPDDVLIRVHAAATTPGELRLASGEFRLVISMDMPLTLGFEGAGVVAAVGSAVKTVRVGDEVIGCRSSRPAFPSPYPGWIAEYTIAPETLVVAKPPHLSFEQVAGVIGSTVTAYQSFRTALRLMDLPVDGESLEGKTVYIPGALSSTGSIGCQMAKNVFGAAKVVSTVSTPKLPIVEDHLGRGLVDHVIDYTKKDVVAEVGRGSVDLVYNTQWGLVQTFPLLNPETGVVVSIASIPPPEVLRLPMGEENLPFYMKWVAILAQWWYDWNLRGTRVKRATISGDPGNREDMERCVELVATGKVKAVSTVVSIDELEDVRREFIKVAVGKGGIGSLVVKT